MLPGEPGAAMGISSRIKYFKLKALLLGLCAVTVLGAAGVANKRLAANQLLSVAAIPLDLARPDVVIVSERLSRLPADALRVPLLRDVLTNDLVEYYEHNEARLSLLGTVRRLAYEQQTTLGDDLVAAALDEPAEVAMWRDGVGKTQYWLLKIRRNTVAKALEALADIATRDTQLRKVGDLTVAGSSVPLFALDYASGRTLLFAASGSTLLALSDPGMLFQSGQETQAKSDPKAAAFLQTLLADSGDKPDVLLQRYALSNTGPGHHLAVSADYLSFGYQSFFPALDALRFDFNGGNWQLGARVNGAALPADKWSAGALWPDVPALPAACAALPLQGQALAPMVKVLAVKQVDSAALTAALAGPAAVCWYGDSRLSTPLFVARFKSEALAQQQSAAMARIFTQVIGAKEAKRKSRFPVLASRRDGAQVWTRVVSARYGTKAAAKSPKAAELAAERYFDVSMAVAGENVYFSPDGKLVEKALAVHAKRFPALADQLPEAGATALTFTPDSLAKLLQAEAFEALPADKEAIFRNAAKAHLIPKLKALAKYPRIDLQYAAALPESETSWVPLKYQPASR